VNGRGISFTGLGRGFVVVGSSDALVPVYVQVLPQKFLNLWELLLKMPVWR
jgi:hypothetical protein